MNKIKKAGALIFKDKKFLIVKPKDKPFWINPGGKYKEGEDTTACLKRELKEELGVELVSCDYYKTYKIEKAAHSDFPLSLELYIVEIKGDLKLQLEIEEITWLSRDDFENKRFNLAPSFYKYVPDLINDGLF